jgi:hypothetical protein
MTVRRAGARLDEALAAAEAVVDLVDAQTLGFEFEHGGKLCCGEAAVAATDIDAAAFQVSRGSIDVDTELLGHHAHRQARFVVSDQVVDLLSTEADPALGGSRW